MLQSSFSSISVLQLLNRSSTSVTVTQHHTTLGGSPNNVNNITVLTHTEPPKAINLLPCNTRKSLFYYLRECRDFMLIPVDLFPSCWDDFEPWYYQPTYCSFIPVLTTLQIWPVSQQGAHGQSKLYTMTRDTALWQDPRSFHYYMD